MRARHAVTVLSLVAASLLPSVAVGQADDATAGPVRMQGTVDPLTGRPSLRSKDLKTPGAGWADAERATDAVARGTAALERCAKAYRDAKTLSDRATIRITLPDGEQEDVVDLEFGEGGEFRIALRGMRIACHAGKVSFVPDEPSDRYLSRDAGTSGHEALRTMLGTFSLPVPDLALRLPLAGAGPIDAFHGCGLERDAAVAGCRESGGRLQVLLAGKRSGAVVSIDPGTGLVRAVESEFSPEGLPEEVKVGISATLEPVVGPLKGPLAPELGSRRAVTTLEAMFGGADAPPPGAAVQKGSAAPVATLAGLDGAPVDLAALKGKVVVLDFWASWCGPCRKGLPSLQAFADEMKGNDRVKVFAVNVWEQCKPEEVPAKVRETWSALKLTLPVLLDPDAKLISQYGFQGIPATVVIGPDGALVSSHMGLPQDLPKLLRDEVANALGTAK